MAEIGIVLPYLVLGAMGLYSFYLYNYQPKPDQYVQGVNQKGGKIQATPATSGKPQDTQVTKSMDEAPKAASKALDFREAGMVYGLEKAQSLNVTNLNEDYKPYSAPPQESTYSMTDFLDEKAKNYAWLEANATPFYFSRDGEIPLASTQQSNPNVEIPSKAGIRGDTKSSLGTYSRAYIDSGYDEKPPTSAAKDMLLGQGEPETSEVTNVPEEGRLNRDWNPWGPGGAVQTLYNKQHEYVTQQRGTNRSHIVSSQSSGAKTPAVPGWIKYKRK